MYTSEPWMAAQRAQFALSGSDDLRVHGRLALALQPSTAGRHAFAEAIAMAMHQFEQQQSLAGAL